MSLPWHRLRIQWFLHSGEKRLLYWYGRWRTLRQWDQRIQKDNQRATISPPCYWRADEFFWATQYRQSTPPALLERALVFIFFFGLSAPLVLILRLPLWGPALPVGLLLVCRSVHQNSRLRYSWPLVHYLRRGWKPICPSCYLGFLIPFKFKN